MLYFLEIKIILAFLLSLIFSALFSGMETAIISINKIKMHHLAEKGDERAKSLLEKLQKIEILIASCLVGNNITIIIASVMVGTFMNIHGINEGWIPFAVVFGETAIFLIFGEIFPKAYFRAQANELVLKLYPFLRINLILLKPILFMIGKIITRFFHRDSTQTFSMSREEIENMFHLSSEEGVINHQDSDIISEVFDFGDTTAREIFVPTINIIASEKKRPLSHIAKLIQEYGYSRIPIFEKRVDNIIGYISTHSLINARKNDTIEKLLQKTQYIPLTKKISEAFVEMKSLNLPLIFVVNEYGAVSGMISLEDITEEIVGEIQTLDHPEDAPYIQLSSKSYLVDGMMNIDEVNKLFDTNIEKKGFETIGGYITYRFDKIPAAGEKITIEKLTITAKEVTETLVKKVQFDFD